MLSTLLIFLNYCKFAFKNQHITLKVDNDLFQKSICNIQEIAKHRRQWSVLFGYAKQKQQETTFWRQFT